MTSCLKLLCTVLYGVRGGGYATDRNVAGLLEYFIDIILYVPRVYSTSNRNEYQEYFLGSKSGGCLVLTTLKPLLLIFMKSRIHTILGY